jgi:uncharacterized protein Yka (UPF0111/DUF47 family)
MPKEEQFFPLFEQHAEKLVTGAETLKQLLRGGSQTRQCCDELNQIDKDASAAARQVLDAVRSTFVAPFDRVNIKSLIMEMDGCLHDMRKTGRAVSLFEVDRFEPCMQEIGDVIVNGAALIRSAMPLLSDVDRKAVEITNICQELTARKEQSDEIADQGVKTLFKARDRDPMSFIANNAIYDHLAAVAHRLESVGNDIHDVVIDQI